VPVQEERRQGAADNGGPLMSDKQRGFLISLAKELGMVSDDGHHDAAALDAEVRQFCGLTVESLTVGKAKEVIEEFMARRDGARTAKAEPAPHPKVQRAIDTREANWIAAMEGAATMGELSRIAGEIAQSETKSETLRDAYTKHRDRLRDRDLVTN
jgi:hypothetical protein